MPTQANSFDPLQYLNIQVSESDRIFLTDAIMDQVSRYVIIRTLTLLPEADYHSLEELFDQAQQQIPNFDNLIKIFLEDFKKDYQHQRGIV